MDRDSISREFVTKLSMIAHSTIFLFHFGNVVFLFFFTISLYSVELIGLLYIADYRKILNCFSYRS
jgi:hypothetical protein